MAFTPDPAYLTKYQKTFGTAFTGPYRGVVSYPDGGDGGIVSAQGNYGPQIQQPVPPYKLPGPAPLPLPVTPVDTTGPTGPPIIAIPGGHRHTRGGWGGHYTGPRGGTRHSDGGDRRHRRRHSFGPRPTPTPLPVTPAPPIVPAPVIAPGGKTCPTWGWMVSTNPDGSETVHQCAPGQPAAAGLHGLDGLLDNITAPIAATLGPNWMLYLGIGIAAYFFMKRR